MFGQLDPEVTVDELVAEGTLVAPGRTVVRLTGAARSLITGERTALNFLQRMSGIVTLTKRYADLVADLDVKVLDTRKTAPGLRAPDKYAVTSGGGSSHRLDLSAMVLLKENHLAAAGGVTAAVDYGPQSPRPSRARSSMSSPPIRRLHSICRPGAI
ncbi:hypothetical protein [Streptomyces sp. NPDC058773]|uniref:hypothetical protein n=1 Tax=Streptomyces sp. NPDC058773 TaxID=3346632 RepID=UPI0036878CA6